MGRRSTKWFRALAMVPWLPFRLFRNGEAGAWYDPSDMSTLFQDSAGTTPVTAVEQPVGLMLDKRLGLVRGPNLTPIADLNVSSGTDWSYGGGVWTLAAATTDSEIIGEAAALTAGVWYEAEVTVSALAGGTLTLQHPDSSTTIGTAISAVGTHKVTFLATSTAIYLRNSAAAQTATVAAFSVRELPGNHAFQATTAAKPTLSARKNKLLATATLATQSVTLTASAHTLSFKGTGTVTLSGAATGSLVGTGASNRVSLTFTPTAGSVTFTVSGSVTEAQLEDGSAVSTYQRVTTATDYDTAGFPHYLKFDGVDDGLSTGSIDFTSTDKMTVVAGVRSLAAISYTAIAELSNAYDTAVGVITLGHTANHIAGSRGTVGGTVGPLPVSIGADYVLAMQTDIAGDSISLRRNGSTQSGTVDQGTGNYGNHPLYIGRRAGTEQAFNGNLNQLVVRGALTADLAPIESFTADKTGVTLP